MKNIDDYGRCSICGETRHRRELNGISWDGQRWNYDRAYCRKAAHCDPEKLDETLKKINEASGKP